MDEQQCLARIAEVAGGAPVADVQLHAWLGHSRKRVQRRIAEVMAGLPAQRGRLVAALACDEQRQRWGAAYALSLSAPLPTEAIDVLLECLGSGDGDVRWAARDILLRLQDAADLGPRLLEVLHAGNAEQRKMAAYALRDLRVHPSDCEKALRHNLADNDAGVRIAALTCLAKVASYRSAAADAVAGLVGDADAGVRRAAAATLGSIGCGTEAVHAALRTAKQDADPSLRRAAQRSLAKLELLS